jgi:hypothetical protein
MKNMRILVVDQDIERGHTNGISFYQENIEIFLYDKRRRYKIVNEAEKEDRNFPQEFNLVFLHSSNRDFWDYLKNDSNLVAEVVIYYTSVFSPNLVVNNEIWIEQRGIRTIDDALTVREAKRIVNWYVNGANPNTFPLRAIPPSILPSLSILCQGYLAINYDLKSSVVHESLQKMGWNTSLLIIDIAKKKLKVQKAEWWLQIFGDQSENIETLLQEECNGNIDAAISNLLIAIRQVKIEPDLVANAYIAISNKLNEE